MKRWAERHMGPSGERNGCFMTGKGKRRYEGLKDERGRPGGPDVKGEAPWPDFTGGEKKLGRFPVIAFYFGTGNLLRCLHTGEVLGHKPRLSPVFSNIAYPERPLKYTGKAQGGPYNLSSAFTITAVDFNHVPKL